MNKLTNFEIQLLKEFNSWNKIINEIKHNPIFINEEYDYAKTEYHNILDMMKVLNLDKDTVIPTTI